jgi:hypothetical protein
MNITSPIVHKYPVNREKMKHIDDQGSLTNIQQKAVQFPFPISSSQHQYHKDFGLRSHQGCKGDASSSSCTVEFVSLCGVLATSLITRSGRAAGNPDRPATELVASVLTYRKSNRRKISALVESNIEIKPNQTLLLLV